MGEWWENLNQMRRARRRGADLSPEGMEAAMLEGNVFVIYARDVPPPLDGLEPGSIVKGLEYDGMPAQWMNGRIFVRKDVLEKHNKQPKG